MSIVPSAVRFLALGLLAGAGWAAAGDASAEPRWTESMLLRKTSFGLAADGLQRPADSWEALRAPAGDGLVPREVALRLHVPMTARSGLVIDRVLLPASANVNGLGRVEDERPYGIGLEFRAANAAQMAGLRQGTLFKMNLSNGANLGLRARKGRLQLVWRAQW